MRTREEKRQAKVERYENLAANAKEASTQAYNRSHQLTEHIPLGQPILIGHHSERRHRNALDKSWNAMGKSVELSEKAEHYRRKAEAAQNNDNIYLEDENAVEKLTEKVKELERSQETMKATNKIIRNKKLTEAEKIEKVQALGFKEENARKLVCVSDCFRNLGFPSYSLTNNNANLNRYKDRLKQAIKLKETETKEYEIGGVKVVENTEENRLQLFFDGKPSEETRKTLKNNSFRWAPSSGCWQSYLKRWQIDRAKAILNPKTAEN